MVLTQPFHNRNLPYSLLSLRPSVLIKHEAYLCHPHYVWLSVSRFSSECVIETVPNIPYWLIPAWPRYLTCPTQSRGLDTYSLCRRDESYRHHPCVTPTNRDKPNHRLYNYPVTDSVWRSQSLQVIRVATIMASSRRTAIQRLPWDALMTPSMKHSYNGSTIWALPQPHIWVPDRYLYIHDHEM